MYSVCSQIMWFHSHVMWFSGPPYSHLIRFQNRGCYRFEPFIFSVRYNYVSGNRRQDLLLLMPDRPEASDGPCHAPLCPVETANGAGASGVRVADIHAKHRAAERQLRFNIYCFSPT